jgi:hypothetical protein
MKKFVMVVIAVTVLTALMASPILAAGKNGQAGKSNTAHLYLYEKNPSTWEIVEDGAWGKMKYNLSGSSFDFVFNGHNLEAGYNYSLIYYPDPWPGTGGAVLANGIANEEGDLHLAASLTELGDLPIEADANKGAKIWLVLSSDYDAVAGQMIGWNPTEYLFEYDLITFDDID